MNEIFQGMREAGWLIVTFDPDLMEIIFLSLKVTLSAVIKIGRASCRERV